MIRRAQAKPKVLVINADPFFSKTKSLVIGDRFLDELGIDRVVLTGVPNAGVDAPRN